MMKKTSLPLLSRPVPGSSILPILLLLLFAALAFSPPAQANGPEILSPPAKAVLHAKIPVAHVVVRLKDGPALQIKIRSNDQLIAPQGMWLSQGYQYAHFRLPLKPGSNSGELLPGGKTFSITYRPLRSLLQVNLKDKDIYQFHRNELLPPSCAQCHDPKKINQPDCSDSASQTFCFSCHRNLLEKTPWQHGPATNLQCLSCHRESGEPLKITIPTGKVEDICFRCHVTMKSQLKKKHVHGPAGTGDCTVCHNPHGGANKGQLWAEGKDALCVTCHSNMKNTLSDTKNPTTSVHGILKGQGCIACHDPHATDHRFTLYNSINELCVSCHTSLKGVTRGHPVGGHPVSGPKDSRRPDRPFTCTSCHNPHESSFRFLLIGDMLGGHVCSKCHY